MDSAASATFQDRTLNKVAVCSAVFAGFAYVGYSYARTAFCRKLARRQGTYDNDSGEVSRVVFRRLSQTTQTDTLLGSLDEKTGGRVKIRPISVQARIRELNLRARQFSDTFAAIQSNGASCGPGVSRAHALHTHQSLQCSPWSSPRLLSPVEMRGLTISQSSENLAHLPRHTSPTRPRWVRRSFRTRKRLSATALMGSGSASADDDSRDPRLIMAGDEDDCFMEVELGRETEQQRRERMERETREMYSSNKEQLIERLRSLMDRGRLLSPFEAKTLVALLCAEDHGLLEKTLVTVANCATFTLNVELLREAGCIVRLCCLLHHPETRLRLAAVQTLGNVLLAEESIMQAESCLEPLLDNVLVLEPVDPLVLASLVVLTNIATIPYWHHIIGRLIDRLYELVDIGQCQLQLQSLRLLVNLSCNREMLPHLLAGQGPSRLAELVSVSTERGVLLRILTLLSTLTTHVAENRIRDCSDLPLQNRAPAPLTMFARILGLDAREALMTEADNAAQYHPDPEVRRQAVRLRTALGACMDI